ncbi:fumarylacetoacetate hydrolase family protein [Xanthobacter tagetidis]|jgi:fumarylpyruvate hydrolase|uniref:FAA hydrolase family protein n=1 Tax=Xanthobacter tagetidis TaxID=60216 RepID=A0A3L7AHU5_9HYPH|nr:fumarylacetoacetate hydrolase family protein [Xanthobacter tagetidis]MBB6306982.1 fumarylpyruvate hydrolase [Xanthobacter tagetidis]RLP79959.1 FAA hydrolase family protein [Xanthobacter tagetidis]
MSAYAFPPLAVPTLPIVGRDTLFPVHRIYCVGRNFADHAIEMGGDPSKEAPFFFQKNPDTLVHSGATIPYPKRTNDVHHEVELVVALKEGGEDIPVARALDHVFGYAVGIDLTRRDLQAEAKKAGRPWEVAKAFEESAPCSAIVPTSICGHPDKGRIFLKVNGETRQDGDLNMMIWKVPEMIAILSTLFRLAPGDLIFAGTPAGVGAIARSDVLEGGVENVGEIRLTIG